MTKIVSSFSDISNLYGAVFCDLWGCVHNGISVFSGVEAALSSYRAEGGKVVLLTNAPRPQNSIAEQLDRLGLSKEAYDVIVTSGDAAQFGMLSQIVGKNVYHIGAEKDESFFTVFDDDLAPMALQAGIKRVSVEKAEGVICTGLIDDLTETPEDYRKILQECLRRNLKMLCVNPDIVADLGNKRLWCAGALARDYVTMGGDALYFGKPHAPIYTLAHKKLMRVMAEQEKSGRSIDFPHTLCIGDGISTDIMGGINAGYDTLFITGGLAVGEFGKDMSTPDMALLKKWLKRHDVYPNYIMTQLR